MRVKLPRVVSSLLLLIIGLFTVGGILVLVLNMWVGEVENDTFAGGGILVLVLDMLVGKVESNTVTIYLVPWYSYRGSFITSEQLVN